MSKRQTVDPVAASRPPKLVHVGFRTTPDQAQAVEIQAKKDKVKPSVVIRCAIDAYLQSVKS